MYVKNKGLTCEVVECERSAERKGFCDPHYRRVRQFGSPGEAWIRPRIAGRKAPEAKPRFTAEQRFWANTTFDESGCWEYSRRDRYGYGKHHADGKDWIASRYSYTLAYGGIPANLEIDHLCINPACVRPDHLEAVTHDENIRRKHLRGG